MKIINPCKQCFVFPMCKQYCSDKKEHMEALRKIHTKIGTFLVWVYLVVMGMLIIAASIERVSKGIG